MTRTRRTWTSNEKRRIALDVRQRLAAGQRMAAIARDVHIHPNTLRAWLETAPVQKIEPVQIQDERPFANTLNLTTPDGFVFGPLHFDAAMKLWERLR
jgi:transposase-like protein